MFGISCSLLLGFLVLAVMTTWIAYRLSRSVWIALAFGAMAIAIETTIVVVYLRGHS